MTYEWHHDDDLIIDEVWNIICGLEEHPTGLGMVCHMYDPAAKNLSSASPSRVTDALVKLLELVDALRD